MNDVATTLPLEVFTRRNFAADFFSTEFEIYWENSKIAFCTTLWGDVGVTYTVRLWLVGKRVVGFLLALGPNTLSNFMVEPGLPKNRSPRNPLKCDLG